ncbi:hypothetical protein THRCLA_20661 [Thraustotheca clavata]|uniref:Uncharacterized protein n=1 Tax=Thraustotheca clavata TaxID=74557 RepID=A0A1W0A4T4_9STRA|nr:hypothetical protein THRCLA_20661 [Thraustotheca clavata]
MSTATCDGTKTIPEGAATTVTLATRMLFLALHPTAADSELVQKLWDVSDKIVEYIVSKLP